jgi:hypothetical protein
MKHVTLALALLAAACGGADPDPAAAIEAYTPESLDPADDRADDLTLTVAYDDGDGDLGGGIATIHDCRVADLATVLVLPPIASEEGVAEGIHITGELVLVVADVDDVTPGPAPATCVDLGAPPLAPGEVAFCVTLTDVGGRTGPGDCTPAIPITVTAP